MSGPDAATRTKQVYYPVFTQKKLILPTDKSYSYWDNTLLPQLEKEMQRNGIKVNNYTYTYKKYSIGDLSPDNVGKDAFGNWKLLDTYVEKTGGKLLNRK